MNSQVAQKLDPRIKLTGIQDGYAEVSLRESANPNPYERSYFVFVHRIFINSETIVRKDCTTWETPEVDGWAQGLIGYPNSIVGNIYPTRAMAANSVIDQLLRMERKMYANE